MQQVCAVATGDEKPRPALRPKRATIAAGAASEGTAPIGRWSNSSFQRCKHFMCKSTDCALTLHQKHTFLYSINAEFPNSELYVHISLDSGAHLSVEAKGQEESPHVANSTSPATRSYSTSALNRPASPKTREKCWPASPDTSPTCGHFRCEPFRPGFTPMSRNVSTRIKAASSVTIMTSTPNQEPESEGLQNIYCL